MFSYQSSNHNLIIKSQILLLSLYVQDYIYVEVTGQNSIQVKFFYPRLILSFLCLLALIIHELGLRDQGN